MKLPIFYLALLTAACALLAWLWPVDREGEFILVAGSDGKTGYINEDGRVVIELEWDDVGEDYTLYSPAAFDEHGLAKVTKDGGAMWQLINRHGQVLPGTYDEIGPFDEKGMAWFRVGAEQGFMNTEGEEVIALGDKIIGVNRKPTPGLIGAQPTLFPPPTRTRHRRSFDEHDMLLVGKKAYKGVNMYGWMDRKGEWVIAPTHLYAEPFQPCGLATVRAGWGWGAVNRNGNAVVPCEWDSMEDYDAGGLAIVSKDDKYGLLDTEGKLVVAAEWDEVLHMTDDQLIGVTRDGKFGVIDREGNFVIPLKWDDILVDSYERRVFDTEGYVRVMSDSKIGWINREGDVVLPLEWQEADPFNSHGLASVKKDNKWGFIDRSGKLVIPLQWDRVGEFDSEGVATVDKSGSTGLINVKGELVLPAVFDSIGPFDKHGLAAASIVDVNMWVNREGKLLVPTWLDGEKSAKAVWHDSDIIQELIDRPDLEYFEDFLYTNLEPFDEQGMARILHHYGDMRDGSYLWSSVIDPKGNHRLTRKGEVGEFSTNGLALVFDERLSEPRLLGWVDQDGNDIVQLEGKEWLFLMRDVSKPDGISYNYMARAEDYLVVEAEVNRSRVKKLWLQARNWLGADPEFNIEKENLCHCYDKTGKLIWSSVWMRFETKCIFVLVGALLVAFFARPRQTSREKDEK